MKKTLVATTLIAVTATALAVNAATDADKAGAQDSITWMPLVDVITNLESQGYQVMEIEREDGVYYEVEMLDANGFEVDAYLDGATGEPVSKLSGKHKDSENDVN